MFVVVQVDQDYDYVSGVNVLAKFEKEKEAEEFLKVNKEATIKAWIKREEYISGFVDAMDIPEIPDYYGKKQYLETNLPFNFTHISWDNIKPELKRQLRDHRKLPKVTDDFKDYNPPSFPLDWNNTFIIEV